jgi:hypothetical protein
MTTTCLTVFLASPILAADAPVPAAVHAPLNNISPGCHQAAWLPYWENEKYVRSSPAGVKVNLHNRPGQALLATIVNTGPKACQAELALDLKTLGQPEAVTAHNILTGKRLPLASGRLTISLGPLEYVILRLATKESSK